MAWIESHQTLGQHPKTRRFARYLGVSLPAAVGHLHYLWWWALDYAQDGDLSKFEPDDIAEAALWEGDAKAFVEALIKAGFIDQDDEKLVIHDWDEYAGRLIDKRKANRERQRRWREQRVSNALVTRDKDVSNGATITKPNHNQTNNQTSINTAAATQNKDQEPKETKAQDPIEGKLPQQQSQPKELTYLFERELGRPVSPLEAEIIQDFAANHPRELVQEALRRAVAAGRINLRYVRGILASWRQQGIKTVREVLDYEKQREEAKAGGPIRAKPAGDTKPPPVKRTLEHYRESFKDW